MSTSRLIAVKSGRPIASERWGVNLGAVDILFWLAIQATNARSNPLDRMDALAEVWRELDAALAQELPEVAP